MALAGALIFLLSLIALFLLGKRRRTRPPAKLAGTNPPAKLTGIKLLPILPVALLVPLVVMSGFIAGIILLVALISPHGMPVCNGCGGG
jgi:hypothetical protein